MLVAQPGAWLQEELDHLDVLRQAALFDQPHVFEIGIVAEHPLRERLDQSAFELAVCTRHAQRQCGDDREMDRRVFAGTTHEGVDERIGLADGHRQAEHDVFAYAAERRFDARIGVRNADRHAGTCRWMQRSALGNSVMYPDAVLSIDPSEAARSCLDRHLAQFSCSRARSVYRRSAPTLAAERIESELRSRRFPYLSSLPGRRRSPIA